MGRVAPWVILLALTGCSDSAREAPSSPRESTPIFIDVATSSGLTFKHSNGAAGDYRIYEVKGAGVALLDYDQDGDLDAYLVQGEPGPEWNPPRDRLYRNELEETGELGFADVSASSGITPQGYGMGIAVGDVNNDGFPDIYLTNVGANQLFQNNGDGSFTDITEATGIGDPGMSTSAAFLDYDRDGWLDLYVANYVRLPRGTDKRCYARTSARDYCGPSSFSPEADTLYRNRGDGTFEDISVDSGIALLSGPGLGVVATDFDGDSWLDLYVANDAEANRLWMNQGDGSFRDQALTAGCAYNQAGYPEASMGLAAQDFDGDGLPDIFVTHLAQETNTLYRNLGGLAFQDQTVAASLGVPSRPYTSFGSSSLDYDNDGWIDLFVANGAVLAVESLVRKGEPYPYAQPNQLFRNLGGGRFQEVTAAAGEALTQARISRGTAMGDVDNDGDSDVLVQNVNGSPQLLLNQVGQKTGWLGLRLLTGQGGRDAYGAQAALLREGGDVLWRRVGADASFCSSSDPRALLGVGEGEQVEGIRVHWADGGQEVFPWQGKPLGQYWNLHQGSGEPAESGLGPGVGQKAQPDTWKEELKPVPVPDLALLSGEVRGLLEEGQRVLDQTSESGASGPDLAELFGELGMRYHAHDFLDAALACYQNARVLAPDDFRWPYYQAVLQQLAGDLEAVEEDLVKALELEPSYVPAVLLLSRLQWEANRLDEAEDLLNGLLVHDAANVPALILLAHMALQKNELKPAVLLLEEARRLAPWATEVNRPLGQAYLRLGEVEKGQALLASKEAVVKALPQDPLMAVIDQERKGSASHRRDGQEALQIGDLGGAIEHFEKVLEAEPEDLGTRLNLAAAFSQKGEREKALEEIQRALDQAPRDPRPHLWQGHLLATQGEDQAAVEAFESALALDPDLKEAQFLLAQSLRRLGRHQDAAAAYARSVELDPGDVMARYYEARSLAHAGSWSQALDRLETAVRVNPDSQPLVNALARVLAACPEDDLRDGHRAWELVEDSPATVSALEARAMALAELERYPEAVEEQEKARSLARQSGQDALALFLDLNLRRYQRGEPCRQPWPVESP